MGNNQPAPLSGDMIKENGSIVNVADAIEGTQTGKTIQNMMPRSGRYLKSDGTTINLADLVEDATPTGKTVNIDSYAPHSGEIVKSDGSVVNFADILEDIIGGGGKLEEVTITPAITQQVILPSEGYDGFSKATVNAVPLETTTITPSDSQQVVKPSTGKLGFSQVTVEAQSGGADWTPILEGSEFAPVLDDATIGVKGGARYLTAGKLSYTTVRCVELPEVRNIERTSMNYMKVRDNAIFGGKTQNLKVNANSFERVYVGGTITLGGTAVNQLEIMDNAFYWTTASKVVIMNRPYTLSQNYTFERATIGTLDFRQGSPIFGANAFWKATIENLILRGDSVVPIASASTFTNMVSLGYIYVPSALVDTYKNETNYTAFADQIRAIEDYPAICGI